MNLTKPSYQIIYTPKEQPWGRKDRLEQSLTDFQVQSVIVLTSQGMTSMTPHSNLCIQKCACGTPCKWPLVQSWILQLVQQCRYSVLGETKPNGWVGYQKLRLVSSMSYELLLGAIGADWSLEIWILEVYCQFSVLWDVGMLVGSCQSCFHGTRDLGTSMCQKFKQHNLR